jgi:hypothetical protein
MCECGTVIFYREKSTVLMWQCFKDKRAMCGSGNDVHKRSILTVGRLPKLMCFGVILYYCRDEITKVIMK